jgi:hypothetical protein
MSGVSVKIIEARLDAWAAWAKRNPENVGYARTSISYRMMEDRRFGIRCDRTTGFIEMPEAIAETDRAVAALPKRLREVVFAECFEYAPREAKAKKLRMSRRTFGRMLDTANNTLAKWFSNRETMYSECLTCPKNHVKSGTLEV